MYLEDIVRVFHAEVVECECDLIKIKIKIWECL